MNMNDSPSDTPRTAVVKKPYEKPSFRYEQVFVTTALTCGKMPNQSSSCNLNHQVS
jgi:hypothetical protein